MTKLALAIGLFGLALVALLGLYLLLKGARNIQMALASTAWPRTSGVVLRSDTTRDVTPASHDTPKSVTFDTKTVIRYAVNGQDYTTDVLHFGQTLGSGDKSEAALQRLRFPAGKEVPVSYNPRNPSTAVMKPGLHAEAFWLPGAGLAFLIPVAMCLIMGPTIVRDSPIADDAFDNSVKQAIADAQRGHVPISVPLTAPLNPGGDKAMAAVAALLGAVACGLGLLALTAGLERLWHGAASQNWPTTPGEVIYAATEGGDDTSDSTSYARFVYEYQVDGAKHFNNVRRFAQVEGGDADEADRVASRYHKGAKVTVSYFLTDPDVAVLEPGNTSASLVVPGIGLAALLFSLAVFFVIVPAVARP
jgi:hypothetical protein